MNRCGCSRSNCAASEADADVGAAHPFVQNLSTASDPTPRSALRGVPVSGTWIPDSASGIQGSKSDRLLDQDLLVNRHVVLRDPQEIGPFGEPATELHAHLRTALEGSPLQKFALEPTATSCRRRAGRGSKRPSIDLPTHGDNLSPDSPATADRSEESALDFPQLRQEP